MKKSPHWRSASSEYLRFHRRAASPPSSAGAAPILNSSASSAGKRRVLGPIAAHEFAGGLGALEDLVEEVGGLLVEVEELLAQGALLLGSARARPRTRWTTPKRWPSASTASVKLSCSVSRTKVITSPALPQPKHL